jgi:hypothetical protein
VLFGEFTPQLPVVVDLAVAHDGPPRRTGRRGRVAQRLLATFGVDDGKALEPEGARTGVHIDGVVGTPVVHCAAHRTEQRRSWVGTLAHEYNKSTHSDFSGGRRGSWAGSRHNLPKDLSDRAPRRRVAERATARYRAYARCRKGRLRELDDGTPQRWRGRAGNRRESVALEGAVADGKGRSAYMRCTARPATRRPQT